MKTALFSLAFVACTSALQAAVVVNLPTASLAGSLVITDAISFTVTEAGTVVALIFDEWVAWDGARNNIMGADIDPPFLHYSVAGQEFQTGIYQIADNVGIRAGAVSPNDGHLYLYSFPTVEIGQTFRINPGAYALAAGSMPEGFNPQVGQTFTGDVFLVGLGGVRLTANTPAGSVPEPLAAWLVALGGLSLSRRKR